MEIPRRIMVYGVTGSGKTTLARKIGEKTGLPWHSVDDLTWEPGWKGVPEDEQRRRFQAICDGPEWILDTAYGSWRDVPMASVELIVALDYPRWLSFARLLRRSVQRAVDKKPICNGNFESFSLMLSRDSILRWHFKSFKSKHTRIAQWAANPDGPRVLRFRHPRETEAWLRSLA
jgi:adenylate kinase family enzyme